MHAALIGAVEFNTPHFKTQNFDFVVAVDRGYATCVEQEIKPDIVVGDFDSLGYVPEHENVKVHSSIKDESDMELALRLVHARGYRDVSVYGALSGRLDHTLANIQVFASFAAMGMNIVGIGTNFAVATLSGASTHTRQVVFEAFDPQTLSGEYGLFFSAFAVGGRAEGVVERGLKYTMDEAPFSGASSLGLSNEFIGEGVLVSLRKGTMVVMFALDALAHMKRTV